MMRVGIPEVQPEEVNGYNISDMIFETAMALGLEACSTGGNMDFVIKVGRFIETHDVAWTMVLSDQADSGSSPDRLKDPSFVTIYIGGEWQDGISFKFPSAGEAMQFMASSEPELINIG